MLRAYLCGEGKHDMGRWALSRRDDTAVGDGVLGTLARRVKPTGWEVANGCQWKRLTSLRVGKGEPPLAAKLRQLEQLATDSDCQAVLFGFDVDNRPERAKALADALTARAPDGLRMAGAAVDPCIEGWVLELRGERPARGWTKAGAQRRVAELGLDFTAAMEAVVADWNGQREGLSAGLTSWLVDAEWALSE